MEEALMTIFAIIAVGIALLGIYAVIGTDASDTLNQRYNDQALSLLAERSNNACFINIHGAHTASFEASSGTIFFLQRDRICYESEDHQRCLPLGCNATEGIFLDLSSDLAKMTFDKHTFLCTIEKRENLSITC